MTSTAAPASQPAAGPRDSLVRAVGLAGLACLVVITLASPGATRMFAWPWSLGLAGAVLAPVLALLLRAFDSQRPLILPAREWCVLGLATAGVVLVSALASPHRGPSLLWAAPLLGGIALFFVIFDWLHTNPARHTSLANFAGFFFGAIALVSLGLWLADLPGRSLTEVADARNPYPLGHSNYTGALALLALPWFGLLGLRAPRPASYMWAGAIPLTLVVLATSGSRGAVIGLGALAVAALFVAPFDRRGKLSLGIGFLLIGLSLALAHPRTRAMFQPAGPAAAPNISNVQRTAMLTAGWRMGTDRPLLGWGPGTTPLVYPRYRAGLDGGTENVLQLHCTPVHLWAEFGAAGVACALAFAVLALRDVRRDATAAVALAGYGVFSLTDWQLDIPVFAAALATCTALLARPAPADCNLIGYKLTRPLVGGAALAGLALVALLGRPDPTPELNARALVLARDPATADRAIAMLRESLAQNTQQEIAHFNLGWLLVVRDPATAEKHFLAAAHLVPDKGGVYFGLGLARLNQGRRDSAARAFALESLNDPVFLSSPWWSEPGIAALRDAARAEFAGLAARARPAVREGTWAAAQLARVAALAPTLGEVPAGPARTYRRERLGYGVLMRNLNFPPPVDLFDVREVVRETAEPLPPKGWLPTPLLLTLLDAPAPK
jgi:hypothetical protein